MIYFTHHDIFRVLKHLITSELAQIRHIDTLYFEQYDWDENIDFIRTLEIDSSERVILTTAVSQFFHIYKVGLEQAFLKYQTLGQWIQVVQQSWTVQNDAITFFSSGSMNKTKSCEHTLITLIQEVELLIQFFSETKRIVSFVPCHHIYGFLFTIILPKFLAIPVVEVPLFPHKKYLDMFEPYDLIIGTPTCWEVLERTIEHFPEHVQGITSTHYCPPQIIHALYSLGLEKMTEIYGTSETAGIGYRTDPYLPYLLFPHWQQENEQTLLRFHPDGNATSYVIPNQLVWEDMQHYWVGKRTDCAIKTANQLVYPEQVRQILQQHPAIVECVVRPIETQRALKALIVLTDIELKDDLAFQKHFYIWLHQKLLPHEVPKFITFTQHIPKNGLGKVLDWQIEFT